MWLPLNKTIFNATILKGEQSTRLCWCQCFYNTAGFSWLCDTKKKLGFIEIWMVPFWVTSSWATLWKKFLLFVLNKTGPPNSTENILFSSCMVRSFCCCHHWFGPFKIAPSTVRIDKTQKSGHLVTIFCWGEAMPIPAHILLFCFYFRKASNASLHLQKANIPSVCVHCITEEFSLPCK